MGRRPFIAIVGHGPELAREEGAASTLRGLGAEVRTADLWDDPATLFEGEDDVARALVIEALDRPDLAAAALRAMRKEPRFAGTGAIVAVTSMNGVAPGPNAGAYGATKAGVGLLTRQMALEWGPYAIRVNAVAPGLIDGGMSAPIYADPEVRRRREARVPLGRLGAPADVAAVVLFLLSDAAAYVTGTEVLVDGGVTPSVIATLPRPASVDTVGDDSSGG